MAPKRKVATGKSAAAAAKLASEDVEKQKPSAPAEETIAPAEADGNKAEGEPIPKKTKVDEKKRGRKAKAGSEAKKVAEDDGKVEEEKGAAEDKVRGSDQVAKVVVIEASKECNCFKTRAAKVQTGLTKAVPGIEVLINPEKPRKGCFEVRSKDGNIYLSLLGMPRPFTKLKSMDMDEAIDEIVAKVK